MTPANGRLVELLRTDFTEILQVSKQVPTASGSHDSTFVEDLNTLCVPLTVRLSEACPSFPGR